MRPFLILSVLAMAVLTAACSDQGIGRKCVNPSGGEVKGTLLVSPALECQTRLCFLNQTPVRSVCTATCDTDDDCESSISSKLEGDGLCPTGKKFRCAVATVAGPFCCKKICLCQDDLQQGYNADEAGNPALPSACKPGGSSCPNIQQ